MTRFLLHVDHRHRHLSVNLFVYLSIYQKTAKPILMKLGKRAGNSKRKRLQLALHLDQIQITVQFHSSPSTEAYPLAYLVRFWFETGILILK